MPRKKKSAEVVVEEKKITLEEAKALWNEKLNDYFNNLMKGTLTTKEGYKVQFNDLDIMRLSNYLEMIDEYKNNKIYAMFSDKLSLETGFLTLADNTTIFDLDIKVIKSVRMQMMARNNTFRSLKQYYRSIIDEAETIEALEKINFDKFLEADKLDAAIDEAIEEAKAKRAAIEAANKKEAKKK